MAFSAFRQQPSPSFMVSNQFQPQNPQQQQQQQQQLQQQHIHLFTNDKTPVTYQTKWSDIHPDSQKLLLQIEERILQYRDESQRLDHCARFHDASASNEDFEFASARILQELGGISTAIDREKVSLRELLTVAKELLRNAEMAVRSFMILRPKFVRQIASSGTPASMPNSGSGNITNSAASSPMTSVEFYSGLPAKPSPFLLQTVSRFERQLTEYRKWIEELERLVLSQSHDDSSSNMDPTLLQSLPTVLSNVHDYFIYVAAQVEALHQRVQSMRSAYLADQRRRGEENNPFLEADRRELAKREAAAKRTHPSLGTHALSQPFTQEAGLFTSSAAPTSNLLGMSQPSLATTGGSTNASSVPGFSMSVAQPNFSSSSSLFSTPAVSSSNSLFGSSGSTTTSLFGQSQGSLIPSTGASLFPSTPAASSSSLFSTPAFGSTSGSGLFSASTGSSTSFLGASSPSTGLFSGAQSAGNLFNTSSSFGAATASGSNFGSSKTGRPKTRTTRR